MTTGADNAERWHLAQLNIATLRAPLDHPSIHEFRDHLAPINALADSSEGFVWRLQTDSGDATDVQVFDDPLTIVNLTVWHSVAALRAFAYAGDHRDFLRRKAEWFTDVGRRTALWYLPAGALPTTDDALHRLAFLERFGETGYVFSTPRDHTPVVVTDHPVTDSVSVELINELDAELVAAGPGTNFLTLLPHEVAPGVGAFVVAWLDGVPVGCGAVRRLDAERAEIKRMYVRAGGRGTKVGAALLHELERRAVDIGAESLVLETGPAQVAALALYRRVGFVACACWGEYAQSPTSHCFEKRLDRLPG